MQPADRTLDDGAPLPAEGTVRFDLKGEDQEISKRNRSFGKVAFGFFGFFFAVGTVFVLLAPGRLGLWNYAISLPIGSVLIWMWLGFSLQRPLADMTVSRNGWMGHNIKGAEFRYSWTDPNLRITLSHSLDDETAPFRTPKTNWRIVARPPSSSGLIPETCYEYFVESARGAGLSVQDRKYYVATKGGGYWMVETAIRPKG